MNAIVEQTVAPFYRGLRRLKNQMLNRIDAPILVLAYHRVARLATDPHQLAVTPENFRAHMTYLRDNCRFIRFDEDWSALREPAVAVTFDDGYVDNLHMALPILENTGVPATFFISSGDLDSSTEFWSDELEHLVLNDAAACAEFRLHDQEYGGCWPAERRSQREFLHHWLHHRMLTIAPHRRGEWLDQLRRWRGLGRTAREGYRALTRKELQHLAVSPLVTIGAHGMTHTPLAILGADEQLWEMAASKQELEGLLGREVAVFSYPFGGRGQIDRLTLRLCRQAGFRRAVTTFPGQVHRWDNPWKIPRQLVRNWKVTDFAAKLKGFWTA